MTIKKAVATTLAVTMGLFLALCLVWPLSAEVLLTISKSPFESFACGMDFTAEVGADGITLVSVTSTNKATGVITSSSIIAASPIPAVVGSTDIVAFRVQGGRLGETHIVSVKVQDTVTGETFEGAMLLGIEAH